MNIWYNECLHNVPVGYTIVDDTLTNCFLNDTILEVPSKAHIHRLAEHLPSTILNGDVAKRPSQPLNVESLGV